VTCCISIHDLSPRLCLVVPLLGKYAQLSAEMDSLLGKTEASGSQVSGSSLLQGSLERGVSGLEVRQQ